MNIRNSIIGIKRKLNKVNSFLHKIDKKKERDQELLRYLSKIDKGNLKNKKQDQEYLAAIANFNERYLGGYNRTDWNIILSTVNGEKSEKYIPEDIWINHILPRLNNVGHMTAFEDKNIYDLLFAEIKKPQTYLRYLEGQFFDIKNNYIPLKRAKEIILEQDKNILVKPSWKDSGRGRGVKLFESKNVKELFSYLTNWKTQNNVAESAFLIQEYIYQHEDLKKVYPLSLNTIRIMTCRLNGNIIYLNSRLRMGKNDSIVDQGYFVGVKEDGYLNNQAIDFGLNKHTEHEDTGIKFSNIQVPSFQEAIQICMYAHKRLLRFDIVAWDIAIDKEGDPVFIEMNLSAPDISFMQMACGPLFKQYTEEILNQMNINLHFNI